MERAVRRWGTYVREVIVDVAATDQEREPQGTAGMGVVIQVDQLRRELARRGWSYRDLALASRLSAPTITAAMSGRPIAPRTVRLIAAALVKAPPVEGVDILL